ncbi:hypothetical protein ABW19_dt0205769 [Dactylella cylindrospora]|nr:hypothetical protein ABW19_dt0205769 [Dactylella cylindrospora]
MDTAGDNLNGEVDGCSPGNGGNKRRRFIVIKSKTLVYRQTITDLTVTGWTRTKDKGNGFTDISLAPEDPACGDETAVNQPSWVVGDELDVIPPTDAAEPTSAFIPPSTRGSKPENIPEDTAGLEQPPPATRTPPPQNEPPQETPSSQPTVPPATASGPAQDPGQPDSQPTESPNRNTQSTNFPNSQPNSPSRSGDELPPAESSSNAPSDPINTAGPEDETRLPSGATDLGPQMVKNKGPAPLGQPTLRDTKPRMIHLIKVP